MLNKFGRITTKGPLEGHCNICDVYGVLTKDHVPPKGTLRVKQVEMLHIVDLLGVARPQTSRRLAQDGVKFRSLCPDCNNRRLGTKYDPELIKFPNQVTSFLKTSVILPSIVEAQIRPGCVARAVLGHLLAIGVCRRARGEVGNKVVDFFLDPLLPFPDDMNIYCWLYPYHRQVLIRDAGKFSSHLSATFTVMWVMKYFPLGFMVTWSQPKALSFDLINLKDYALLSGGVDVDVPIRLRGLPGINFPEKPENNEIILYGEGAIGANDYAAR